MNDTAHDILIALNGDIVPSLPRVDWESFDVVIAADGALDTLLAHDILPDIVIGDFDSASSEALELARASGVRVLHVPEQETTDFEKAVLALPDLEHADITVIGHAGQRLDHTLGTLWTAARYLDRHRFVLLDAVGFGILLHDDQELELAEGNGQTCSVIGLLPSVVTLTGFQWPLDNSPIGGAKRQSVSNVIVEDNALVNVHSGLVFVYVHHASAASGSPDPE